MSISNQFFSEKLIEGYVKTPPSLQEQALTRIAIQLCQYCDLKNHILCTPKPIKKSTYSCIVWEWPIAEQSFAICETLCIPHTLKIPLIHRIRLIAIRILAWNKEHEIRLEMTPHVDQLLLPSDWTVEGRINERKVAERLVQHDEIPISDRYKIACINCLEPYINSLWNQIPPEDQKKIFNNANNLLLVMLWSCHVEDKSDLIIEHENLFWQHVFEESVRTGQRTAVAYCWNLLNESKKQEVIVIAAEWALSEYYTLKNYEDWFSVKTACENSRKGVEFWEHRLWRFNYWCAMPEHYSDIVYFFFSQMSDDQKCEFFLTVFNREGRVFECFLQSPNQGYFMSVVTKLWGILPEKRYAELLSIITDRYTNIGSNNIREFQDYDYGQLLMELLDATPEHYKRYLFSDEKYVARNLLLNVFKKKPFQPRNIEIILHILKQSTAEEKKSIFLSDCGSTLCEYLIENNNREILDSIIADVLPEEEIKDFKSSFFLLPSGQNLCFRILLQGDEGSVESWLRWGNFSEEEISEFKPIVTCPMDSSKIRELLENLKMDCVERILDYCLPTVAERREFKESFLEVYAKDICATLVRKDICAPLVRNSQRENLMKFLSWAFPPDDLHFKRLFAEKICKLILIHLMAYERWQEFNNFTKWCGLSSEEIEPLKVDVLVNNSEALCFFLLYEDAESVSFYLNWGLSDVKCAIFYKKEFHQYLLDIEDIGDEVQLFLRLCDEVIKDRLGDITGKLTIDSGCQNKRIS